MPIKVAHKRNQSYNGKRNFLEDIRRLMVEENGQWVEKYRLVAGRDKLVYAKGKVKLNFNCRFRDNNNIEHTILRDPDRTDEIFAFYYNTDVNEEIEINNNEEIEIDGGGFYKKSTSADDYFYYHWNNNNSLKEMYSYLNLKGNRSYFTENDIFHDYGFYIPIKILFIGWYSHPTRTGRQYEIDSVQDLFKKTDLFKHKNDNSLPEITLYAHWEIPTFTLKINNILRKGTRSSFQYYDKDTKKWITMDTSYKNFKLIYGTNIFIFLENNIREIKYISWAKEYIKNLSSQKFLGWGTDDPKNYDYNKDMYILQKPNQERFGFMIKDWNIYPYFKALAVWRSAKVGETTIKTKTKSYLDNNNSTIWPGHRYIDFITILDDSPKIPNAVFRDKYNRYHTLNWYYAYNPFRYTYKCDCVNAHCMSYSSTIVFTLSDAVS